MSYRSHARACRALALLATTGALWLALTRHWIGAALLAWTVPNLLVLGAGLTTAHHHHQPPGPR